MTTLDLNTAGDQRSFDVIPANTILILHLSICAGGAGDDGWLRRASDGNSEGLDCEFVVVDEGPFRGRKLWQLFTLSGTKLGHAEAGKISLGTLKAIVESAKGILPNDKSEAAQAARKVTWQDLDQLRFVARIGVRPPQGTYQAKNTIQEVITPEKPAWRQPVQLDRDLLNKPSGSGACDIRAGARERNFPAAVGWVIPMGELSKKEDAWLAKATEAAIAGARKIALSSGPLMNTPVGRLTDHEWSMIVTATIFRWIEVRVQQAIAEGLDQEQTVRLTGPAPDPCDVAVVTSILPALADTAGIDWSLSLSAWSKEIITNFLMLAWQLMRDAEHVSDQGPGEILRKAEVNWETGDPIPF